MWKLNMEFITDVSLCIDGALFKDVVGLERILRSYNAKKKGSCYTTTGTFNQMDELLNKLSAVRRQPETHRQTNQEERHVDVPRSVMAYMEKKCKKELDDIQGNRFRILKEESGHTVRVTFKPLHTSVTSVHVHFIRQRFITFYQRVASDLQVASVSPWPPPDLESRFPQLLFQRNHKEKVTATGHFVHIAKMKEFLSPSRARPSRRSLENTHLSGTRSSRSPENTHLSGTRSSRSPENTHLSGTRSSRSPENTHLSGTRSSRSPENTHLSGTRSSRSPENTHLSGTRSSRSPENTHLSGTRSSRSPENTHLSGTRSSRSPENTHLSGTRSSRTSGASPELSRSPEGREMCPICMELIKPSEKKTLKCKHSFCKGCLKTAFDYKPVCPTCGAVYGVLTGTQPEGGTMRDSKLSSSLPGYEGHGTIVIHYYIPSGIQKKEHPNPGQPYEGVSRKAYLPDSTEGRQLLQLLQRAFRQRLVFTVGRSTTSGRNNTVTWNDIHHKTSTHGGATQYGYPDPDYLSRVRDELKVKGIE